MGTKENMEEIVDAVGSTIYSRSIKGVSVEELLEFSFSALRTRPPLPRYDSCCPCESKQATVDIA